MDYQLLPAVGTTDADGITTFTNRPPGAPLFYLDDNGRWVPVGEASPTTPTSPGTSYTAGAGIAISASNEISSTGYTDAEMEALLADKADLDGNGTVPLAQLPALLNPLSYPVMAARRTGYVGYDTLEAAAAANPFRSLVVNVPRLLVEQDLTLSASLYGNGAQLLLAPGVTITVNLGITLRNVQFIRDNAGLSRLVVATTQGPGLTTEPWQAVQVVDSNIGPNLVFSAVAHAVAVRGNSTVSGQGNLGTIYAYDTSTVNVASPGPVVLDYRPDAASRSAGTVLRFTGNGDYPPIYSGTFTVDVSATRRNAVVFAELGVNATQPTLDPAVFELEGGSYQAGKRLSYAFRVASTGRIRYIISVLP